VAKRFGGITAAVAGTGDHSQARATGTRSLWRAAAGAPSGAGPARRGGHEQLGQRTADAPGYTAINGPEDIREGGYP
jgi:hypothetical protein